MRPMRHLIKLSLLIATLAIAVFGSCGKSSSPKRRGPVAEIIYPVCCRVSGEVPANYRLIDRQSEPASAEISFSTDGGLTFQLATESLNAASDGTSNLATAPKRGVLHVFIWDTVADFGYVETAGVQFRIYPYDSRAGKVAISPPFVVDNTVFVPPEVIDVSDSLVSAIRDEVTIRFSKPIDPSSLVHQGTTGDTFAVFRDRDGIPGGPMDPEVGTVLLVDGGRLLSYVPPSPFSRGREIRMVLTGGIMDLFANSLVPGTSFPSAALSFTTSFPDEVFEVRFIPWIGPETAKFQAGSGNDIWFIDFDTFGTFDSDLANRGLRGPDTLTAAYCRDRVIGRVLATTGEKYLRDAADGSAVSGSYRISFVGIRPPGTFGWQINRMCIGLNLGGLWGAAWLDWGNNYKEDDCRRSGPALGVFAGGIWGLNSSLSPSLGSSDLEFVDGSYLLGNDPVKDSRFLSVRGVIWDWGHSIAVVNDHEVGHSVGLPHDDSSNLNIMRSWASPDHVSNPSVRFSGANHARLRSNLGRVP